MIQRIQDLTVSTMLIYKSFPGSALEESALFAYKPFTSSGKKRFMERIAPIGEKSFPYG